MIRTMKTNRLGYFEMSMTSYNKWQTLMASHVKAFKVSDDVDAIYSHTVVVEGSIIKYRRPVMNEEAILYEITSFILKYN